jgi:hypothetical protein
MMSDIERIWQGRTDEELAAAAAQLASYTEPARLIIQAELRRRGLAEPAEVVGGTATGVASDEIRYLQVSPARIILLSILSFGVYEAYWIYKNWNYIKARTGRPMMPFWRGIFGIFFCHSLFREIYEDSQSRALVEPTFSAGGLATGFVVLTILGGLIGRAPGAIASIIGAIMPSYLCLVPVQNYVNEVGARRPGGLVYYGWSLGHIVCIIIGLIVWVITFVMLADEMRAL